MESRRPIFPGQKALSVFSTFCLFPIRSACGGSGSQSAPPPPPAVSIQFSTAPPATVPVAGAVDLTAVVSNTTSTAVTWSVTCGSPGQCGSFPIIEGGLNYASYNAPNDIPVGKTVTVTATLVSDTTKSVSATMTVTAGIRFYSAMPAAIQVARSYQPWAIVGANSETAPILWTASCSSADCGSFDPAQNTSFYPTTYTPPASVPAGGTVVLTATSGDDPTQSVSAKLMIVPAAPTIADGTYVFQFTNPVMLAGTTGAFTVQNGTVIGGEQDSNSLSKEVDSGGTAKWVPNPQFQQITGGAISTTLDGELQVALTYYASQNSNVISTETITGELTGDRKGFVPQLYGSGGNAILHLQTPASPLAGGYAFAAYGWNQDDVWLWSGGILNMDGPGTISGSGTVVDIQGYGVGLGSLNQPIPASTFSSPDAFGRVLIQLNGTPYPAATSVNFAGYVIDSTHVLLEEAGGDTFGGLLQGLALGQGSTTGKFTASSLAGSSFVFTLSGFSGIDNGAQYVSAGVLTANADGTVTGHLTWSDTPGSFIRPMYNFTGSWKSDPTGRFILSDLTDKTTNTTGTFDYNLQMYLAGDGHALLLSNNLNGMNLTGEAFEQQAGTLNGSLLNGQFGLNAGQPLGYPVFGPQSIQANNGAMSLSGYGDSPVSTQEAFPISSKFTDQSNGVLSGTFAGLDPLDSSVANAYFIYVIDGNRAILEEVDNQFLTLGLLQRQN